MTHLEELITDPLPDFDVSGNQTPLYQKRWSDKKELYKKQFSLKSYDEIVTLPNIYRTYEKTRKHKSNKKEVEEYENHLVTNLNILYENLLSKNWDDVFQYHRFFITTPKLRKIDALDFSGRIALHLICDNGLDEWFDRRLVKECAACRTGMGTDYAREMMADHLHHYYQKYGNTGYVLCLDVHHFFDYICH